MLPKALETDHGAPHNELDPRYAGEPEYEESYSETDPEYIENDMGAPNVVQNAVGRTVSGDLREHLNGKRGAQG